MIPLVLLDIDGTLVGSRGHVQDCVWRAADKARDAGIKLAVCTGRPCSGVAQRIAQRLGPANAHIFQNGAHIAYPDGKAFKVFALGEEVTRQLIEHARDLGYVLELYTPNALYVERKTPMSEAHAKLIGVNALVDDLNQVLAREPIIRAQWVVTEEESRQVRTLEVGKAEVTIATSPALTSAVFISITQPGVSKGVATRHLCEALKIKPENAMGIGDSEGDIPLFEAVGHPVVMRNAPEDLRARYPVTPDTVEDCGVVTPLEKALNIQTNEGP